MKGVRHGKYVRIDNQMTWPHYDAQATYDLVDALGYGKPTRTQLFHARSIIGAYQNLIASSQKRRNAICKAIKESP